MHLLRERQIIATLSFLEQRGPVAMPFLVHFSPSIVGCFWVSELTAPVNPVHSEVLVSYMGLLFSFLLRLHMT